MTTLKTLLQNTSTVQDLKITVKKDPFILTERQNYLYRKAIMGMQGIPTELQSKLSPIQIQEINKHAKKVQKLLNLWKQELTIKFTNEIFIILFPTTEFTKQLLGEFSKPDPIYINTLDFKELGVTKPMIIQKLLQNKYLPDYFMDLNKES